jgi:tetratricopeptide (TPR) repeat protein
MTSRPLLASLIAATVFVTGSHAFAIDLIHRKSTEKTVGGEVTKNTRDGITVTQQVGMKEELVPAADIAYIEWDAEPGPLKLARGSETTGALDEAVKQYQEALKVASSKEGIKTDMQFGLARVTGRKAIRTGEDLPGAVAAVKAFVNANRDNYRFYEGQLLLGELSLAAGDFNTAEIAYQSAAGSSSGDFQRAGKVGVARAILGRGDVPKAKSLFGEVAAAPAGSPSEQSHRLDAILGQALCLQKDKDTAGARKLVEQVIDEAKPTDAAIQAEAYLRQGDLLMTDGGNAKAAIIAYLHVDVIPEFAELRDLHAESLYQLAKLWPTVGEAERGADAATRLKSQYPQSAWNRKLSGN